MRPGLQTSVIARPRFYLHVPFCRQLCFYCACNTTAMNRPETLEGYARAVVGELENVARIAPDLVVGAHVPWMKPRQAVIDAATLPGTAERVAMAGLVEARLVGAATSRSASTITPGRATR